MREFGKDIAYLSIGYGIEEKKSINLFNILFFSPEQRWRGF